MARLTRVVRVITLVVEPRYLICRVLLRVSLRLKLPALRSRIRPVEVRHPDRQ